MKLAIMQPYFFPYIGYWQLLNAVDMFVIYDDVNYIKQGWVHRNKILMNGRDIWIHLQIDHASQNKLINEVEIVKDPAYDIKMLKTLEHCYGRAPHFDQVMPLMEKVITQTEKNLAKYLEFAIRTVCEYLAVTPMIIFSSSISKNNDLHGQDRIIDICKILEADEYINAIGGQGLYCHEDFDFHGIKLRFLRSSQIRYHQFNNDFVENLSIIDVMMFNDKESIKTMLNEFQLFCPIPLQKDNVKGCGNIGR